MQPKCENCRFYYEEESTCRRYPPSVYLPPKDARNDIPSQPCYAFPPMFKDEWCGEHQPILPVAVVYTGEMPYMQKGYIYPVKAEGTLHCEVCY